jgi:membrane-associated phospholipid phosphatase
MAADTLRKKLNAGTFPSMHTIVVTIIAMMIFRGVTEFGFPPYVFLLYMVIVVAVALSRVALKKHYPTDVLFGVLYGVAGVYIIIYGAVLALTMLVNAFNLNVY